MSKTYHTWQDYQVNVPEGESGPWKIRRVVVDDDLSLAVFNMHEPGREIPPGTAYAELTCNGDVVMTDTPSEIRDHYGFFRAIEKATRPTTVLIHGLGLGMALNGAFVNGADHVTVVEKSPDVIRLAGPHWQRRFGDKLTIIQADAFTWKPEKGQRWNVILHDVWPDIDTDNLKKMGTLHRRFCRRCDWQGSWSKTLLLIRRDRERRAGWR